MEYSLYLLLLKIIDNVYSHDNFFFEDEISIPKSDERVLFISHMTDQDDLFKGCISEIKQALSVGVTDLFVERLGCWKTDVNLCFI